MSCHCVVMVTHSAFASCVTRITITHVCQALQAGTRVPMHAFTRTRLDMDDKLLEQPQKRSHSGTPDMFLHVGLIPWYTFATTPISLRYHIGACVCMCACVRAVCVLYVRVRVCACALAFSCVLCACVLCACMHVPLILDIFQYHIIKQKLGLQYIIIRSDNRLHDDYMYTRR